MTINKYKKVNLRILIIVFFIAATVLSIIYKYFEWSTIRDLVSTYNNNWSKELKNMATDGKEASEAAQTIVKLYDTISNNKYTYDDVYQQFDKTIALINVGINESENHINIIKQNKQNLNNLRSKSLLLFGKKGELIKNILNKLNEYYDLGIKNVNTSLVQGYVFKEYFNTFKDNEILQEYYSLVKDDPINKAPDYFYVLSPLEKYTREDFKLSKEEEMKSLFPQSYIGIMKSVAYSRSYYSFVKDQAMGDVDSANYKWSKLNEDGVNLSFDIKILSNEGNTEKMELEKKIIRIIDNLMGLTKNLHKTYLVNNIFGKINNFMDDAVGCTLYSNKGDFYYNLTKKYPKANSVDELIKELSTVAPTTENIDGQLDKKTMNFVNNDTLLKYICKDKVSNSIYTFTTIK